MDLGKDLINNLEKNNLKIIKKKETNFYDKIYEKAYQTFLSNLLNGYIKDELKNISPIKLTRSVNVVK